MRQTASIVLLLFAAGAVAQTTKTAPKQPSSTAKKTSTAPKRPVATSKTKSKSKKRVVARSRVQQQPTPARYTEIQQALADKGYFSGPSAGLWGPDSIEALKRFQEDQKLAPTGKIDALSLIRLGLGPKREAAQRKGGLPPSVPKAAP